MVVDGRTLRAIKARCTIFVENDAPAFRIGESECSTWHGTVCYLRCTYGGGGGYLLTRKRKIDTCGKTRERGEERERERYLRSLFSPCLRIDLVAGYPARFGIRALGFQPTWGWELFRESKIDTHRRRRPTLSFS